ncbi:DUF7546 family protein [Halomicrobium urmianum]|uniref:DUF7546 family protein n=1 Tax=Halomicrobium urmianum TaxID=1586233 RepID=UPI001CDA0D2C|nr:hypothetical protein [Halomicrobium urmianum]
MNTTTYSIDRFEVRKDTLLWGLLLLNSELLLVFAYLLLSPNTITGLTPVVVPFVWINLGLWAIVRTDVPPAGQRRRRIGVAVAVAYFGLLTYFGGMWGLGHPEMPSSLRLELFSLPPGWAPALLANTPYLRLSVLSYQVVGYLALAYLVYATVLDAAGSAVTGVVGLLSCVSCSWPILAGVVTGLVGGSTAVAAAVYDQSYLLSTVVFSVTVGLLYWRPGFR